MKEIPYKIEEIKEEDGHLWARITLAEDAEVDVPLAGVLEELDRRCSAFGLRQSEAINWILTIPGLDEFFGQILEHKKRILQ